MKLPYQILTITLCLFIAGCSFNKTVKYDVKTDKKTGIIYNQEWDDYYDEKAAYYNASDARLNVRKGPGETYNVIAYLEPKEGGFIRRCNFDLAACYMDFGGALQSGWVNMKFMAKGDVEYNR